MLFNKSDAMLGNPIVAQPGKLWNTLSDCVTDFVNVNISAIFRSAGMGSSFMGGNLDTNMIGASIEMSG